MATPPPLPVKSPTKKNGCVKLLVIGFVVLIAIISIPPAIGVWMSEREWKRDRSEILRSVERAVNNGEYATALSLGEPHKHREDADLDSLLEQANTLKKKAEEQKRQKRISQLVLEIKMAQGADRESKLKRLVGLDPGTKEYPEEISAMREKARKAEEDALAIARKREEEELAKKEAERRAQKESKEQAKAEEFRQALEEELARFKWRYEVSPDALTSKPAYHAAVKSINRINFGFPYQGEQRGELMLRTHPQYGKDLIVRVEKGQMLVQSYEDTTVKVVFDDGDPISYRVTGAADHSTTSLFIRDYHGFVQRMVKAKKVKISVPFYQEGNVVFEFNVMDFDSEKYLGKN